MATKLRQSGRSYNEISSKLNISKSTLSAWFKDDPSSQEIKSELNHRIASLRTKKLIESNKIKWAKWYDKAREEAVKDFDSLSRNPLFVAGLMLYWGEGDSKPKNPLRLTNTNPGIIRIYKDFLLKVIKVPKSNLRVGVIIYPDLSENSCVKFWSSIVGIPKSQFHKTQIINGKHPTRRLSNGICMIICGNQQLKEKFRVWIDLLSKKL